MYKGNPSCNSPSKQDLPQLKVIEHAQTVRCNSPSKLDLPQLEDIIMRVEFGCNSPSKLDLPQHVKIANMLGVVVIVPQNWTFHNNLSQTY